MRHLNKGRKFHREKGQRTALFKGLVNNIILKERIETTEAKAKELRPKVEKLITLAKKQNLASHRVIISRISKKSAEKLFYDIAKRYKDRNGGYLRIIKGVKRRKNDGARMSIVELV